MPPRIPNKLLSLARERVERGSSRRLAESPGGIDICSNDYLGLARLLGDQARLSGIVSDLEGPLGATGSRLVSGHTAFHDQLEEFLARFHKAEAALLFGSGYEANVGLLSSLASRVDTIVYDEFIHASMRDGIRLSHARSFSFRHNDLEDLRVKLSQARGECYIAVESLYSMDGDLAPLEDMCRIANEVGAHLIVDEAHATGVYGLQGEGLVVELSLEDLVFARVHTFGKALGFRGACVVGAQALREHLINTARTFIYSTASDALSLAIVQEAYRLNCGAQAQRTDLKELIHAWSKYRSEIEELSFLPSETAIQGVLIPGNHAVTQMEDILRLHGFFARAIRSPTVPSGQERIRICLHSFNSIDELTKLIDVMRVHQIEGFAA
jgi:8-amino-7-oxononanoate synthase